MMSLLFAVVTILLATSNPVWGDGLNDRARKNGLHYFGTEVSTEVLNDAAANAIAVSNAEFGAYTCEYEQKFAYTEPSRNNFSYSISDRIVNQALKNNSTYFRRESLSFSYISSLKNPPQSSRCPILPRALQDDSGRNVFHV